MSKAFWLEGRATIVLLPSAEEGEQLFALATNWAEVGLLGPALWVTPENVTYPENEPIMVKATVLGTDRNGQPHLVTVDLFEQLARENLSIIRLVKVRSVTPQREFDETQNTIARAVEDALQSVMPSRDVRDSRNSYSQFQVTNLIAAPSAHSVEQRLKWELHSGSMTIVASPEDRSSPWATDAFIRSGDRFVGFVLMHLATVGGLWNGLPIGTLELFEREESGGQQVWLSRVFVSSVLTDGLARRVAAQVLHDAIAPDSSSDTPPAGCAFIDDHVRDEYIDSMVEYMMRLDDAILSYRRPAQLEDPEKVDLSIPAQIVDYFKFSANKSLRIPYWAYRFVRGKIAGFLEGKLQGEDGLAQVEMNLRRDPLDYHDRTLLDRENALADMEREARKASSAPIRLSEIRSAPSLWASIREMVFGALDGGSDLSNKGFPLVDTKIRPIFRNVSQLFPDPDTSYALPEGAGELEGSPEAIGWDNYDKAMGLEQKLSKWQGDASGQTDEHNSRLADYSSELSTVNKRLEEIIRDLESVDAVTVDEAGESVPITIDEARSRESAVSDTAPDEPAVSADQASQWEGSETSEEGSETTEFQHDGAVTSADDDSASVVVGNDGEASDNADLTTKRASFFQAFSSSVSKKNSRVVSQPEGNETPEQPPLDLEALIAEHKKLTKRVKQLKKLISTSEEASRQSQEEQAGRESVASEFKKWQVANERSLLWKFRGKLRESLATAESDLAQFKAALEEIEPHEPGTLTALRKAFHKKLLVTHAVMWAIFGLAAVFGLSNYALGQSGAEQAQVQIAEAQAVLEPQGVLPGAPTAATFDSYYANATEIKQSSTEPVEQAAADAYIAALDALSASWQARDVGQAILGWLLLAVPTILLVSLLALLIPYYRKWSVFRRHVDIQLTNLERIQRGNQVCRSEIERMKALHAQTMDWLKILAMSAHTPWEVRPSWLDSGLSTLQLDSLPFAMRVAQAHDGDHASMSTLVDSANNRLAQPGWRQRAFERLIDEIGKATGRSPKTFSLEALDQDLPHATNNSRSHLLKHMRHSDYLQRVAIHYLKPLIEDLQGKAMATARPEVFQVEKDALEEIKGDIEGIDDNFKYESWDSFLSHTLTLANGKADPVTALSAMAIAPEKIMDAEHEQVTSYALLPEHVHSKLDQSHVQGLEMHTYDSKTARPLDTVIRVDLVGPLSFASVRLVSGDSPVVETPETEVEDGAGRVRGPAV